MKKQGRKTPSYLDVAEYILSGPFSPKISPNFRPIQPELIENLTPLSRPLYIQVVEGQRSPYLKQLLSKVGGAQVQFFDFTLQSPGSSQQQLDNEYFDQQQQKQMSIIEQQQQQEIVALQEQNQKTAQIFQYNPEEYIPNMHLLDIDPSALRIQHFNHTLQGFRGGSPEEKREFISLYLTDDDLDTYKDAELQTLIDVVRHNLTLLGVISRLQRKAKVSRYLQKKKKRIWKKKINYDCRKKVADNRLRVKGKFVTRQQACGMLGIQLCSQQELRQLLKTNYHKLMF